MLENKYQIHEFNPTIYPFRLWVGINPSLGDMQNKFYALTDKMERTDFTSEVLGNNTFTIATCYPVSDKKKRLDWYILRNIQKRQIIRWGCRPRSKPHHRLYIRFI